MNDTHLHARGDHNVLRIERRLAHPIEKVWRAVTDPAHLSRWFPATVQIVEARPGGALRFVFPGAEAPPSEGTITELDPPRVFAFVWNGEPLRIELSADGAGCLLVFTHEFTDRPMAGSFAAGWHTCLDALVDTLAGRHAAPTPTRSAYAESHDAYVAAFGLDTGAVEEMPEGAGGTCVRFERILPHPADEVWAALAGPAVPVPGAAPPAAAAHPLLAAGPLIAAEPCALVEYAQGGGRVRWELTGGHPAGTRVVLTHTGVADAVSSLAAWHAHLEVLAGRLRGITEGSWPQGRVGELTGIYRGRVEAR